MYDLGSLEISSFNPREYARIKSWLRHCWGSDQAFFWQRRCREASLLVSKQNERAVKFYERNDFKDINRAAVVPHGMNLHQCRGAGPELCVSRSIAEPEPGALGQGSTLRTPV